MTRYKNDEGIVTCGKWKKLQKKFQNKKSPEEEINSELYKYASYFIHINKLLQ